ncbi:MAG: hypothetical protein J6J25_04355 [Bacteroidales bacterium]|nr:hypothetical protein [Bacteroidaceae bacterium]MBP3662321.1 hypothetical protein [Bacteroidales bacterium]
MAKLYKDDGTIIEVEPKNGRHFRLEELYEMLECDLVEMVFLRDNKIMLIYEEGKYTKSTLNVNATNLYNAVPRLNYDWIAGHAIVCESYQFR